ncbi:MAG: hypothetical protein P8Q96_02500 [Candidatus Thalassarchaeaceae archaeon]|nr:hypothetical protein [Candidatus Thalassarchaeaceae archaeon]
MARIDSLILVMLGLAQILIGNSIALEFLAVLLQGTGGGTIVMAIYFLIFLSKHQKEFDGAYSKLEKTTLIRDESGELVFQDSNTVVTKVIWYIIPVGLTIVGAIVWLAS